jgi:hypothetical protein
MKLWIDDVRPAPEGYEWCKSVKEAKKIIVGAYMAYAYFSHKDANFPSPFEVLDMDHDSGDYHKDGGDFIEILKWFEKTQTPCPPIRLHSMNPVGVANMRAIIERNGWKEVR